MASDAAPITFMTGATGFIGTELVHVRGNLHEPGKWQSEAATDWTSQLPPRLLRGVTFGKDAWLTSTRCWLVMLVFAASVVVPARASMPSLATPTPIDCAPAAPRDLSVRVIDEAGISTVTLDAAEKEAAAIWASAGVHLTWTSPSVPADLSSDRTVVVIVRRALPAATDTARSQAQSPPALGSLVFRDDGRPGNLIVVSWAWVSSLVMSGGQEDRRVSTLPKFIQMRLLGRGLGRVIAHEIGHRLMGRGHTQDGLMRASFGVRDLLDRSVLKVPRSCARSDAISP